MAGLSGRLGIQKHLLGFAVPTTVAMADAAHALVFTAPAAGQTRLDSNMIFCDPDSSGASEILTLPAEEESQGLVIWIFNTGGEGIVVKSDGAATIVTLATAKHGMVACNGVTWIGFCGGVT